MSRTIEILQQAVEAWYRVTDCPVEREGTRTLGQSLLAREAEQVAQMLDMDKTGLTSYILLKAYYEEHLKDKHFSAMELLTNPKVADKLKDLQQVRDLLHHPDVMEDVDLFASQLKAAVAHYGAVWDESLAQDTVAMAVLQRNAVLAINSLHCYQFVQGKAAAGDLKFNPYVYEFWNIQSLVRAMQAQRHPGISVCLIRDPDVLESFFVFAISNGENLTVLVDKNPDAHPAARDLTRRPDKEFLARSGKYHFPYELTDVKYRPAPGWDVAFDKRTALVPINLETVKLSAIKDLRSDTILWLTMMFDLIRVKYEVEQYRTPELSYTTDMIREPDAIVGANTSLVLSGQYKPLIINPVTKADLDNLDQWAETPSDVNDWMIARYGHLVPDTLFNLMGENERKLLLELEQPGGSLARPLDVWGKPKGDGLRVLNPLVFGSEDKIRKDVLWTARHNQMVAIQRLAAQEFRDTQGEILDQPYHHKTGNLQAPQGWFVDAIERNLPALLDAVARGELVSNVPLPKGLNGWTTPTRNLLEEQPNALGFDLSIRRGSFCAVNGKRTEHYFTFTPWVAGDIALMCGCSVEDLPWQLQNWTRKQETSGNYILERIDPKDWVLRNPWSDIHFKVRVNVSQSGYNTLRKNAGLPRKTLLDRTKPDTIGGKSPYYYRRD